MNTTKTVLNAQTILRESRQAFWTGARQVQSVHSFVRFGRGRYLAAWVKLQGGRDEVLLIHLRSLCGWEFNFFPLPDQVRKMWLQRRPTDQSQVSFSATRDSSNCVVFITIGSRCFEAAWHSSAL